MANTKLIIDEVLRKLNSINFNVKGILLEDNSFITLGSDSKIIGRIFELLSHEVLQEFSQENGWSLEVTESQTVYPDFTLKSPNGDMFALDIKSTYRRYNKKNEVLPYSFTLGSYASFLRNNTKNIAHPYDTYKGHIVIGFVYDRTENAEAGIKKTIADEITSPYRNVEYFVQEKHRISGDKPGSGNTENIGSLKSNDINDFINGNSIFSQYDISVFEDYWRRYPKYRAISKEFTTFEEYKTLYLN